MKTAENRCTVLPAERKKVFRKTETEREREKKKEEIQHSANILFCNQSQVGFIDYSTMIHHVKI